MSTYRTDETLAWADSPVRWSLAAYNSIDRTLGTSYLDYPVFDHRLDTTQATLVREAFSAWEAVSGIRFQEVADGQPNDIRIGIDAIDGPGGTLGFATYWWSGGSSLEEAAIAFDSADLPTAWTADTGAAPAGSWSFYVTAKHEIGHAIGIGHLEDPDTVMYPYANNATALTPADIDEAVKRYGTAPRTVAETPADTAPAPASPDIAPPDRRTVDDAFYLAANPDVAGAGMDPAHHYAAHGWREGRDPVAWFDTDWYLSRNADVAAADIDPFAHYASSGAGEGRDPNAWTDADWYLADNPDVAAAGANPVEHYWNTGWRESRDPSGTFDTSAYLAANPDVAAAGINPLEHWLLHGESEGRALA